MRRLFLLFLVWPALAVAQSASPTAYELVNPIIGSSGEGMTSPTAQLPFGMVQWGPDTHVGEWWNYAYEDQKILGFSMTHISGAGCRLYNDLPVLPWVGEVKANPGVAAAYSLSFSHSREEAHPGYYAVTTEDGIKTELTAALRSGMARFTFPAGATRTLLLEAGSSATADYSSATSDISIIKLHGNSASGRLTSGHFCNSGPTYTIYYTMQFSEPFASTGGWDTEVHSGAVSATGHKAGAWVTFAPSDKPVLMKVSLSYVSVENAEANLKADVPEAPGTNFDHEFDGLHHAAEQKWSAALSKIDITGGAVDQRSIFYTGLFHMLLSPNVFNDSNGEYIDFDGKTRQLKQGEEQYTNFSDWDTAAAVNYTIAPAPPSTFGTLTIMQATPTVSVKDTAAQTSIGTILVGTPVTFSSSVASQGLGTPTGTVTFEDVTLTNNIKVIGSGMLSGGTVSISTTQLLSGSIDVEACYGGSADFAPTCSAPIGVTISNPTFSLSINPQVLIIKQGQFGSAQLTVTPIGNYTAPIVLECAGLPLETTCAFSPSTVTLSNQAAQNVTLLISTTGPSAKLQRTVPWGGMGGGTALALLAGAFAGWRRKRFKTGLYTCLLVAMLGLLPITGCSGLDEKNFDTPLGTYPSVSITGSSNSTGTVVTQTLRLSVTN